MKVSSKLKIVIAEDEPAILRYIKAIINETSTNYEVIGTFLDGKNALENILIEKPDIVITDIMMPFLTGLDLIKECKKNQVKATFIILTGYEKFEYARQALSFGVTNYLLKPLDSKELKSCLLDLYERSIIEKEELNLNILRDAYWKRSRAPIDFLSSNEKLILMSVFFGAIGSSLLNTCNTVDSIINQLDFSYLRNIESLFEIKINFFSGNYKNEYVFAIVIENEKEIDINRIKYHLFQGLVGNGISVTLCSCEPLKKEDDLDGTIKDMYFTIASRLIFSSDLILHTGIGLEQNFSISNDVLKYMNGIGTMTKKKDIENIVEKIVGYWEEIQATQLAIQNDLRYIFQHGLQCFLQLSNGIPNVNDIIYNSLNYQELKYAIINELNKIYSYSEQLLLKGERKKNLAEEVKNYLNMHYSEQINFKDFSELIGYNEKYITTIFKNYIGISPSRYLQEKRINTAKKLLEERPDAMLKSVSEMVGYSDPLYFSRVFKSSIGVSPSDYAKKIKNRSESIYTSV